MVGNAELRRRLSSFTALNCPDPCSCEEWPGRLAAISRELPNSITVLSVRPEPNYNCIAFALGLHDSGKHYRIARYSGHRPGEVNAFADTDFLTSLLASGVITPKEKSPGLIVYFDGVGTAHHAGHLSGTRVRSKWGGCWLADHDIWEVPADYGDTYELYEQPDPEQIEAEFLAWAEAVRHVDTAAILARSSRVR